MTKAWIGAFGISSPSMAAREVSSEAGSRRNLRGVRDSVLQMVEEEKVSYAVHAATWMEGLSMCLPLSTFKKPSNKSTLVAHVMLPAVHMR